MPIFRPLLLILMAYLSGSIPVAYLAAKMTKGIDIRHYGSGTVSGSMVYEHVSRWLVVVVGILDIAKAAVPTYLALLWNFGQGAAAVAGMAAVIGHNWPIYLGFKGGRGLSPFLGVLLVLFPWGGLWLLVFLAIGFVLKDSAPWALASIVSMPLLIWWLNGTGTLAWLVGAALVIILTKRLEANQRPLPLPGPERRRIVWMRLIFDRDMIDHDAWIHRRF